MLEGAAAGTSSGSQVPLWDGRADTIQQFTAEMHAYARGQAAAGHNVTDNYLRSDGLAMHRGPLDGHRRWYVLPNGTVAGVY
jgi:hypothetical protein